MSAIYFYPHGYFRDRQLDTVRNWPGEVANPDVGKQSGKQVASKKSIASAGIRSWVNRVPLINFKIRPKGLGSQVVVYVWGGLVLSGKFIVDLDNPYSLTGYNIRAFSFYKPVLKNVLLSNRCIQIRCMSRACLENLRLTLGEKVANKAVVSYPYMPVVRDSDTVSSVGKNRIKKFLYISTQFDIKGGRALIAAFSCAYKKNPNISLEMITHLPEKYKDAVARCPGVNFYPAEFNRQEIAEKFMSHCDVLIHPTYVDSFGMVVLEAMSYGMALIATDVYAISEMVRNEQNGILLQPPVSIWDKYLPSQYYYQLGNIKALIEQADDTAFSEELEKAILYLAEDEERLSRYRKNSLEIFLREFGRHAA
ncbi:glycosyltransferase family 4 protein [Hahella aquimaris]|uniref:glycosyltransferase family 4 protein n=1 Tax=Hahella sp. HNIBRBA332 TaxID=3015983 RepID=UPI00273C65CF|nr:glycosyltransferase family 4 protein [Hahella sp. HNIBRBA332]WLQ15458.1 glycosyltransferase family 4 protein [Hahella sp. HNIBRBA332]